MARVNTMIIPVGSQIEYFAAHAPAKPQDWFEPTMETECPKPPCAEYALHMTFMNREGHVQDGDSEEYIAYVAERNIWANQRSAWEKEWDKQRLIQWPFAWARAVLEAEAKHEGASKC